MDNRPGGFLVPVLPPATVEDLLCRARADYLDGFIDLAEFERRAEWLLRHPRTWPSWAGVPRNTPPSAFAGSGE